MAAELENDIKKYVHRFIAFAGRSVVFGMIITLFLVIFWLPVF